MEFPVPTQFPPNTNDTTQRTFGDWIHPNSFIPLNPNNQYHISNTETQVLMFIGKIDAKLDTILSRIEKIEDKIKDIWYSPDGPVFKEAKKDFEHLSNENKK